MVKICRFTKKLQLTLILIASLSPPVWAGSLFGDMSGNGVVDYPDLQILCNYWLDAGCLSPSCEADLDGIAGVNMSDFARLAENWGQVRVIDRAEYADRLRALWSA